MAGSGRRIFSPGEVLTASNTMNYLMDQAVMVFPDSGARGSAIGSAVSDGMVSYLADTNSVEVYKTVGTAVAGWESNTTPLSPNVIINGDFGINQRAFTSTTSNGYGFDRWYAERFDGTVTYSSQAFTPGAAPVAGYESTNFARMVTSGQTSSSAYAILMQRVEDVRTLAGQTATVSFWAKAASGTPKIAVEFDQQFGSGGSPSARVTTLAGQVTLSTSWARYSLTVAVPSIAGKTVGTTANSSFTAVDFWFSSGSTFDSRSGSLGIQSNTFDLWGVQVEAGSTATPFRRNANSLQGELAACQRYYIRQFATGSGGFSIFLHSGFTLTSSSGLAIYAPPQPMRAIPNSLEYSTLRVVTANNAAQTATLSTLGFNSQTSASNILLDFTCSAAAANVFAMLQANNSTGAFIAFSAEL